LVSVLPDLWSGANWDTVWVWGELTSRVAGPTLFGALAETSRRDAKSDPSGETPLGQRPENNPSPLHWPIGT